MKISYDSQADALSIAFDNTTVTTQEWAEGIVGEYDAQGRLAGIEILDVSHRLAQPPSLHNITLEGLGGPGCKGKVLPPASTPPIWLDEGGVPWVDDTNVKVIEIVLDKLGYGLTSEQIHADYPDLSLAQIHTALAYYYAHKAEFDEDVARQAKEYDSLRAQNLDSPIRQKLRTLGKLP